jgi:hypothetical protein
VLNTFKQFFGLPYAKPIEEHDYVLVCDPSAGLGRDFSVAHVIDISVKPFNQAAVLRDNTLNPEDLAAKLAELGAEYNYAPILVENNNGGMVLHHLHESQDYPAIIYTVEASRRDGPARATQHISIGSMAGSVGGVRMTPDVKATGLRSLRWMLQHRELRINDTKTYTEFLTYANNPKTKKPTFEALPGNHDDAISALILFGWLIESPEALLGEGGDRLNYLRRMMGAKGYGGAALFHFYDDHRGGNDPFGHTPPGCDVAGLELLDGIPRDGSEEASVWGYGGSVARIVRPRKP